MKNDFYTTDGIPYPAGTGFWDKIKPPVDISTYGRDIDFMFSYITWVGFFFFILVLIGLVWFVWEGRNRPGHKATYTHGNSKNNFYVKMLIDAAVFISLDIPLIAGVWFFESKVFQIPSGDNIVKVQVMPQQWVWNFKNPGVDGKFGTDDDIITMNELVVPKGQPIVTQVKSRDVIHGFFIPNVRVQVDALPGKVTTLWFDANQTGTYEIVCAHLCGTSHFKMKAHMKVLEAADYQAWVEEQSQWAKAKYNPSDKSSQWGWNWGI